MVAPAPVFTPGGIPFGATPPATGVAGETFFDTTLLKLLEWDPIAGPAGTGAWVDVQPVPAGPAVPTVTPAGAPIDFPDTTGQPTDGSFKHVAAGRTWSWNSVAWINEGAAPAVSLHALQDVDDGGVVALPAARVRGVLVRDDTIADGQPGAIRVDSVLDMGVYR